MAFTTSQRALITGRFGFTGSHLGDYLRTRGWDVFGLERTQVGSAESAVTIDINDTDSLTRRLSDVRPTHIVHLAASSHVVGDPLAFFRVNVLGTESLMEAIVSSGIRPAKVIIASSANVYGNARSTPVTENEPLRPMNYYGLSKASMEQMLLKWQPRLPISITRPFNYTGPGQSPSFLIPKIAHAFHRRDPVIKLGNLDVARDLSGVRFVCEAYLRLLQSDSEGKTFNICSGRSIHLSQILELFRDISGHDPLVEVDPNLVRKDEIKDLCGSPKLLFNVVGEIPLSSHRDILSHVYKSVCDA